MNKDKRETIFGILLIIGLILILGSVFRYLQPADISGSWKLIKPDYQIETEFYFTGREATILVVGLLVIFAAFLFKYKKLPSFSSGS